MQRIFCLTLGLILSALLSTTPLRADPPAGQGKIRILLTVGGHDFEVKPFYAMFDAMPDVSYTKATMPKDAGLLKPGLEKEYDVLVRYDMVGGVTPEQEKSLVELLNRGIGLVALHHNLGAHSRWPEYRKIIGGKWIVEPCEIDGKHYVPSLYSHGETIPVTRGRQRPPDHARAQGFHHSRRDLQGLLYRPRRYRALEDRPPEEQSRDGLGPSVRQEPRLLPDAGSRPRRL